MYIADISPTEGVLVMTITKRLVYDRELFVLYVRHCFWIFKGDYSYRR